jgi:hypothetical protein
MLIRLALISVAAFLQASFVLPMSLMRAWALGAYLSGVLLVRNASSQLGIVRHLASGPFGYLRSVPPKDLVTFFLFGAAWGSGAVLFGLGMDRFDLEIGYPSIMGLSALIGVLVSLFFSKLDAVVSLRGVVVCLGMVIAIAGMIVLLNRRVSETFLYGSSYPRRLKPSLNKG